MDENNQVTKKSSRFLMAFNVALTLMIVFMIFVIENKVQTTIVKKEEIAKAAEKPTASNPFDKLSLQAKAIYVYDVGQNKVIYKKNEFEQLPLASITKLMMALTAYDLIPKNSKVTINSEFLQEEGDSGLLANESWKFKDLLDFSLVSSSNDGARSIASVVGAMDLKTTDYDLGRKDFISKMNQKAQELGLKQTYFINETGLDENMLSGGYGSAIDVEKLLQYIIINKPEIVDATKYAELKISSETFSHAAKNTNLDITTIPGLIASKTGYTELAGGNLAVAFDPSIGRPIVVVVLGSTQEGRFSDVSALVKASLEYIKE